MTLPDSEVGYGPRWASAECQRRVSRVAHADHVTQTDADMLIAQLISGQTTVTAGIVDRACTSKEPNLLVAAALISPTPARLAAPDLMARAAAWAATTRDRQLVAIATAHLAGDTDRVDALAREHLVDYPDSVLVSWLASTARSGMPCRTPTAHPDPAHNSQEKS